MNRIHPSGGSRLNPSPRLGSPTCKAFVVFLQTVRFTPQGHSTLELGAIQKNPVPVQIGFLHGSCFIQRAGLLKHFPCPGRRKTLRLVQARPFEFRRGYFACTPKLKPNGSTTSSLTTDCRTIARNRRSRWLLWEHPSLAQLNFSSVQKQESPAPCPSKVGCARSKPHQGRFI